MRTAWTLARWRLEADLVPVPSECVDVIWFESLSDPETPTDDDRESSEVGSEVCLSCSSVTHRPQERVGFGTDRTTCGICH